MSYSRYQIADSLRTRIVRRIKAHPDEPITVKHLNRMLHTGHGRKAPTLREIRGELNRMVDERLLLGTGDALAINPAMKGRYF